MDYTINNSIKAKYYGSKRSVENIRYIVIHYTANTGTKASAKGNANYFKNINRKASAHYVVDAKKDVYQCVPDEYAAYSVGGDKYDDCKSTGGGKMHNIITNSNSISIEMVSCSNDYGFYIPEETINRTVQLVKDLMKKYPQIEGIYRHFDVTGKHCPDTHCITQVGEQNWKDFLHKIKEGDEEPMTQEERKEFDALKAQVANLGKIYHYVTEVPSWGKPTMEKLLKKGLYTGSGPSDLNLPETLLRILVINDRAGLYD